MKDKRIKSLLIEHAKRIHGHIRPCSGHKSFDHCFSERDEFGELIFWFNVESGTTKIIKECHLENIDEVTDEV